MLEFHFGVVKFLIALVPEEELVSRGMGRKRRRGIDTEELMTRT